MKEFAYTFFDDFELLHYDKVIAESIEEAKDEILASHENEKKIEFWDEIKDDGSGRNAWVMPHRYYLRKSGSNEIIYSGPRTFLWAKLLYSFFLVLSLLGGQYLIAIVFCLLLASAYVCAYKITITHDSIVYERRYFFSKIKKIIDVSNGNKILFSGKIVKSSSGSKAWHYFFIYLVKNDQQMIPISGSANINAERCMATKIGKFLNIPVEEN